jgi:hypothetical protein
VILYNTKAKSGDKGGGLSCVKMFKLPHTGAALMNKSPAFDPVKQQLISSQQQQTGGGEEEGLQKEKKFIPGHFVKVSFNLIGSSFISPLCECWVLSLFRLNS